MDLTPRSRVSFRQVALAGALAVLTLAGTAGSSFAQSGCGLLTGTCERGSSGGGLLDDGFAERQRARDAQRDIERRMDDLEREQRRDRQRADNCRGTSSIFGSIFGC